MESRSRFTALRLLSIGSAAVIVATLGLFACFYLSRVETAHGVCEGAFYCGWDYYPVGLEAEGGEFSTTSETPHPRWQWNVEDEPTFISLYIDAEGPGITDDSIAPQWVAYFQPGTCNGHQDVQLVGNIDAGESSSWVRLEGAMSPTCGDDKTIYIVND
jgi:hypothetical protein